MVFRPKSWIPADNMNLNLLQTGLSLKTRLSLYLALNLTKLKISKLRSTRCGGKSCTSVWRQICEYSVGRWADNVAILRPSWVTGTSYFYCFQTNIHTRVATPPCMTQQMEIPVLLRLSFSWNTSMANRSIDWSEAPDFSPIYMKISADTYLMSHKKYQEWLSQTKWLI